MRGRKRCAVGLLCALVVAPSGRASGQIVWDDLVFTGGFAAERYEGNFSAVTVPVIDSTDHASAAVGEFGGSGAFRVPAARLTVAFDVGLRQFAAAGFELRDYAPREWVGRVDMGWQHGLSGLGTVDVTGSAHGRHVADRPPMPLFLQPGYSSYRLATLFRSEVVQEVRFDVELDVEATDYQAPDNPVRLDLLDRRSWGLEGGTAFGPLAVDPRGGGWSIRFHAGYRDSEFEHQSTFDPTDPHRRDRLVQVGGVWTYDGTVYAQAGLEGTVNRSNSDRPEYDALSARGRLYSALPWWDLGVNLLAVITGKTYVHEVPYTRLVPGEEADNASVVYLDLNRPFSPTLDAAVRLGWTRAETDIGSAYYSRFGVSFLMYYRPPGF